ACHAESRVSGASGEFSGTGIPARNRAMSLGPALTGLTGIARGAICGFSCAKTLSAVATINKKILTATLVRYCVFMRSVVFVCAFVRKNREADQRVQSRAQPAIQSSS